MTNDVKAALILTTLYVIQGIPIGLIWGSMSSILSENSSYSYSQQAIFTLTYYPYSLKLLWSPLVDSLSLPGIGRRKSWLFASQTVMALLLFYIGYNIETWIQQMDIYSISIWSFFLILSTATQDIAVDGLSLTMLSRENVSYQSLAQSFGINMGYAIAFPMLLTFKISLPLFMYISGFTILCINCTISYWIQEPNTKRTIMSISATYAAIWKILNISQVMELSAVLLTRHITFTAFVSVTSMKLQKKGLSKETSSSLTFILVPLELLHPLIIRYLSTSTHTRCHNFSHLTVWKYAYIIRILICLIGSLNVYLFNGNVTKEFLMTLVTIKSVHAFLCSVQWINRAAFFAEIADPAIGCTYLTVLTTITNLGKTWPKYFVLEAVDFLEMKMSVDGYYALVIFGALYGAIWIYYTSASLQKLQSISKKDVWRVSSSHKGKLSD